MLKALKEKLIAKKQIIKYLISGFTAFFIDIVVLNLMVFLVFSGEDKQLISFISISKTVSATVGISASFLLNRQWAFDAKEGKILDQIFKYIFVVLFNFAFAVILYSFFSAISQEIGLPKLFVTTGSNILTEAVKMVTTYFFYKYFVFKYNR